MQLTTGAVIAAPRARVFAALVDPEVLVRLIPGCESLTAVSAVSPAGEEVYEARIKLGMAGLHGTYTGTARLRDRQPPESFVLEFDGKGGPGFVRGQAAIALEEHERKTTVTSRADVQVGGVIAAVGSRLIEAAARKLADDFFRRLAVELSDPNV